MKVVEMLFEVTETLKNGNERTRKVKVYSYGMFRQKEAEAELKKRGFYQIIFLKSRWRDIITTY